MEKEAKISSLMPLFPLPQYVIVLQDLEGTKLVPIWIGISEGNAIAMELKGEKFVRPLTHDLMAAMLSGLGARIEKVVISDLKENSYYALIHIGRGADKMVFDARPSDSLALAVRVKCPIYIDQRVLDKCPALEGPISEHEIGRFKEQLKTMTPEEFFKRLEESPPAQDPFDTEDRSDEDEEEDPDDDR